METVKKKTRVVDGPLAYDNARVGRPRTSPESVVPGGNLTPALGQVSVYEVDDQTSSNPTVSRGSLAPPRHPRRGRGLGLVDEIMIDGTHETDTTRCIESVNSCHLFVILLPPQDINIMIHKAHHKVELSEISLLN